MATSLHKAVTFYYLLIVSFHWVLTILILHPGGNNMLEKFKTLSLSHLSENPHSVSLDRTDKHLTLDDNAISVLSDFRLEQAPPLP